MATLNSKYFTLISSQTDDKTNMVYDKYYSKVPLLRLDSNVDGTHLAAIHFLPSSGNCVIAPRNDISKPNKLKFQCMIKENKKIITPIISNLTGLGCFNINLMRTDEHAKEIDPGADKSYNMINEMKPYESYEIECDQKVSRQFIIEQLESNNSAPVSNTEKKRKIQKDQEFEIFLSIAGQIDKPDLIKLFNSTTYRVSNFVIIKRSKLRKYIGQEIFYGPVLHNAESSVQPDTSPSPREMHSVCDFQLAQSFFESQLEPEDSVSSSASSSASSSVSSSASSSVSSSVSSSASSSVSSSVSSESVLVVNNEQILNSKAAKLSYAEDLINVNGVVSGMNYNFEKHSVDCSIKFSICPELELLQEPSKEYIEKKLDELTKSYIDNDWKNISGSKKYNYDECTACMNAIPNIMLYPCGHVCICSECTKELIKYECPVCRNYIDSFIKV
jgi:hypothetical protein